MVSMGGFDYLTFQISILNSHRLEIISPNKPIHGRDWKSVTKLNSDCGCAENFFMNGLYTLF